MVLQFILHGDLKDADLKKIINVKSIAWPYSEEKQLKWINDNIKEDDVHVLLLDDYQNMTAYLNMVSISFIINNIEYSGYGIGNVCAVKRGEGHGAILMNKLNEYFVSNKIIGLLFCKKDLLEFYKKQGWNILSQDKILVQGIGNQSEMMILNYDYSSIEKLTYSDRIF